MQQVLCPHCGNPVFVEEAIEAAHFRQEQELEILRLRGELEHICTRFELELQQKDHEIALYREMLARDAIQTGAAASASGDVGAVISEIDQVIARLMHAREVLQTLGDR